MCQPSENLVSPVNRRLLQSSCYQNREASRPSEGTFEWECCRSKTLNYNFNSSPNTVIALPWVSSILLRFLVTSNCCCFSVLCKKLINSHVNFTCKKMKM